MVASQLNLSTSAKIVLLRIGAAADAGIALSILTADLERLTRQPGKPGAALNDLPAALVQLAAAGLIRSRRRRHWLAAAGHLEFRKLTGTRPGAAISWAGLRDTRLIAMTLGLEHVSEIAAFRLRPVRALRCAVIARAFRLPDRAAASPRTLLALLARLALAKQASLPPRKSNRLSAHEQRRLAAQLLGKPRAVASDDELMSALAADVTNAEGTGASALRRALLRRLLVPTEPQPDLVALAAADVARAHARGIPGSRRIFVAEAIGILRRDHPDWRVNDERLKAMLVDAHKQGKLHLAAADLRGGANLAMIRASEVRHLGGTWHYIRVEDE